MDASKKYKTGKLLKTDIEKLRKESHELIKQLVEYIQRKRGVELNRAKLKVKYGEKYGEVLLLGDDAYITFDLDATDKEIQKDSNY